MIKKSLIVASLLLVSSSAMAQNYFVGIDYVSSKLSDTWTDANNPSDSGPDSIKDKSINLKFGLDDIAKGRVYIKTGSLINKNDTWGGKSEYYSTSLNYDYYITKADLFTPYIGVGIGQGKYKYSEPGFSISDSGVDYSARVGSLVKINDNINFEMGYAYTKSNAKLADSDGVDEIDSIKSLYAGFNYKF